MLKFSIACRALIKYFPPVFWRNFKNGFFSSSVENSPNIGNCTLHLKACAKPASPADRHTCRGCWWQRHERAFWFWPLVHVFLPCLKTFVQTLELVLILSCLVHTLYGNTRVSNAVFYLFSSQCLRMVASCVIQYKTPDWLLWNNDVIQLNAWHYVPINKTKIAKQMMSIETIYYTNIWAIMSHKNMKHF